jgi:predicted nicotinamide N-methyase
MDAPGPEFNCRLPVTPLEAVGETVEEEVMLPGRTFRIRRPAEPDRLLDHPAVIAAHEQIGYMPYWCDIWPAARMLAKAILQADWPAQIEALELGCGLGLSGIAALAKGLRVTFSDYDATALHFAAENARLNGYSNFEMLQLDWNDPPARQFPLLIGSDLLYEERNVAPVVSLIQHMLGRDGVCLLTDQDRKPAPLLRATLTERGLHYTTHLARAGEPGRRVKGTLYRIRHPF